MQTSLITKEPTEELELRVEDGRYTLVRHAESQIQAIKKQAKVIQGGLGVRA